MKNINGLIDKLYETQSLEREELLALLEHRDEVDLENLMEKANRLRETYYDKKVYMRGLIEFTNYCKQHCKYCGIRSENKAVERYRLTQEQILECVQIGYELGYRTFVLQGGEDPYYTDDRVEAIVAAIHTKYPECAITLSIGERPYKSYKRFFDVGARRYLLRHETASKELYNTLHPYMSFENRMACLQNLKKIGYQVGTGFIVGLPGQTNKHLVEDLLFLKAFQPHMVGIGPFIPQKDTPLGQAKSGTCQQTTYLLSLIRLILPKALLPATTSLGTIDPQGREQGLKAGANVVMPNLSPVNVREKYALYDGKICTGDEAAQCRSHIENRIKKIGFEVDMGRGDAVNVKY